MSSESILQSIGRAYENHRPRVWVEDGCDCTPRDAPESSLPHVVPPPNPGPLPPPPFPGPPPPPPPPPPAPTFCNTEQSYTAECPEGETGDPVTVTKEAGTLCGFASQAEADAAALAIATSEAIAALDCLPEGEDACGLYIEFDINIDSSETDSIGSDIIDLLDGTGDPRDSGVNVLLGLSQNIAGSGNLELYGRDFFLGVPCAPGARHVEIVVMPDSVSLSIDGSTPVEDTRSIPIIVEQVVFGSIFSVAANNRLLDKLKIGTSPGAVNILSADFTSLLPFDSLVGPGISVTGGALVIANNSDEEDDTTAYATKVISFTAGDCLGDIGTFCNTEQSFVAECPEGTTGDPVTIVVPPDTLCGYATQEEADDAALAQAQEEAEAALECTPSEEMLETITGLDDDSNVATLNVAVNSGWEAI